MGEKVKLTLEGRGIKEEVVLTQQQAVQPFQLKSMAAGSYVLKAATVAEPGGKPFTAQVVIRVEDWNAEAQNLYTDPVALRRLASLSGGQAAPLEAAGTVADRVKDTLPPAIRQSFTRYQNLRTSAWFLVFLVILATAEWMLRRLGGKL